MEQERRGFFLHVLAAKSAEERTVNLETSFDLQNWSEVMAPQPAEVRQRGEQVERLYPVLLHQGGVIFYRLRFEPPW